MNFIEGTPRDQLVLFSDKLDNIIDKDHIIRFIDLYVEKMDLLTLKIQTNDKTQGIGYNPSVYLKIYIYSYLNKLRSSRKIENECKRNIELIWLTKQLAPDHWSISNFRKKNKKGLMNIFKEFLKLCYKLKLINLDCVAIDGTKMRAQNGVSNVYKKESIYSLLERIEEKINIYLKELESNDKKEHDEYEFLTYNISEKIKKLKKHKNKLEIIKNIFEKNPDIERIFANDSDSRFQKDNGRNIVGYNCQSVVDEKNKLIITTEVTNKNNDRQQLSEMTEKIEYIQKELEFTNKSIVVADAGYHSESEIMKNINKKNLDIYVPHPMDSNKKKTIIAKNTDKVPLDGYKIEDFEYDKEKNIYICPENKILKQKGNKRFQYGKNYFIYKCKECAKCQNKDKCTTNKKGRTISAGENFKEVQEFRKKMNTKLGKKIINKRKELVEHPFGTIKRNFGYTYFMQKGLESTKAEFSFISFIYNFKRVVNIIGVKELIKALN
jgi:transposase